MNTDKFIRELAKKYGKDERVIHSIVDSPFVFAKRVMTSLDDERSVRIPKMGTFVIRWKKGKHLTKLMILSKAIKRLMYQYKSEKTPEHLKEGILHSVNMILEVINREGYSNEQSVQYIINWKNRIESGSLSDPSIQRDLGEGQDEDEGQGDTGD